MDKHSIGDKCSTENNPQAHRIGIFIYDDAEVLDFAGPFEVFSTAQRLIQGSYPPLEVFLVAESTAPIKARGGFLVTPSYSIHQHPPLDTLLIAGGVHERVMHRPMVQHWLQQQCHSVDNLASVCTGVFLLAESGILHQHSVTTHWEDQADLQRRYPQLKVIADKRWVEANTSQPRIISSGGISAGIDMSLHILGLICDQALAIRTAKQMEFDWQIDV
ncbi:MAG: DJ-1/PfpI family protein [Cellvibrionaceae bacterium]